MAEDSVTMNTFYRDFLIFYQNSALEKGASPANDHICCRRACSSTLPFFAHQLEGKLLMCKPAALKKRSCSRPAVLTVNFYNLLVSFIVLQIWIFYSFLSFSPNISLLPLVSVDHNFLCSKKALNNNHSDLPRQPEGSNSQVPLNFWGNLAPNSSRFFLKMSFLN